jgi:hypothetical protein
MKRKYLNAAP